MDFRSIQPVYPIVVLLVPVGAQLLSTDRFKLSGCFRGFSSSRKAMVAI